MPKLHVLACALVTPDVVLFVAFPGAAVGAEVGGLVTVGAAIDVTVGIVMLVPSFVLAAVNPAVSSVVLDAIAFA